MTDLYADFREKVFDQVEKFADETNIYVMSYHFTALPKVQVVWWEMINGKNEKTINKFVNQQNEVQAILSEIKWLDFMQNN